MKFYKLTEQDNLLIQMGLSCLEKNFDDGIYHHTVGCALLAKSGKIYCGVNWDNVHGACAEYVTIGSAISNGEREFDTIVAVHDKAKNQVVSPCGNCRQMLLDYCEDIKVIINDDSGALVKVCIKDLLPFAWKPVVVE